MRLTFLSIAMMFLIIGSCFAKTNEREREIEENIIEAFERHPHHTGRIYSDVEVRTAEATLGMKKNRG